MNRHCCDEHCEQGRNCPAKPPVVADWVDGFALGVCFVASLVIIVMALA